MAYVEYLNACKFQFDDCYYRNADCVWVFKDKVVDMNDNGEIRYIYLKDVSHFRVKKALFVIKYLEFDGQVVMGNGQIGNSKKEDLNI